MEEWQTYIEEPLIESALSLTGIFSFFSGGIRNFEPKGFLLLWSIFFLESIVLVKSGNGLDHS